MDTITLALIVAASVWGAAVLMTLRAIAKDVAGSRAMAEAQLDQLSHIRRAQSQLEPPE